MAIIIPGTENDQDQNEQPQEEGQEEEELKYKATDSDEEEFFLMYNMHMAPSEIQRLDPDYRKWLIARFIGQKQMEREMFERQRLMHAIGPNLKG